MYAVYLPAGGTEVAVRQLVGSEWTAISTAGDLASNDSYAYGTLAAHWFNGYLYIFYVSSDDDKGWVKYYDEDEGWLNSQRNGGVEVTGTGTVTKVQLASSGSVLYAGWVEDGNAYVRVLE